jgi:hypothetical protein
MSEDLCGREVVVEGKGNDGSVVTASVSNINFTEIRDTTSSWDGYVFTAPETAEYSFDGSMRSTTSVASWNIFAYIDTGSGFAQDKFVGFNTGFNIVLFGGKIRLNKGDKLAFRSSDGFTLSNNIYQHHLTIEKSSSPQTILETETVAARYTSTNGQSIPNNSNTIVKHENIDYDTHNAYDPTTGLYTAPVPGYYMYTVRLHFDNAIDWAATERAILYISPSNGPSIRLIFEAQTAATDNETGLNSSEIIYLDKGDTVNAFVYHNQGAAQPLSTIATTNSFSIARIK